MRTLALLLLALLISGCKKDGGPSGGAGECYANRTCDPGARCDEGRCVACELGEEGCACLDDGTCSSGLECQGAICGPAFVHEIPEDPQCFTPCRSSFTDESGELRECEADGLMRGCIDGATCEAGTCVSPEAESESDQATCASDIECPDFQVCIQGRCYADCEYDSDCPTVARCHRHACRIPCGAEADTCFEGTYCAITDGDRGFCMPLADPEEDVSIVPGSFGLSSTHLALSNLRSTESVVLAHDAPQAIEFTVRKLEHRRFGTEPETVTGAEALPWLSLGAAGESSSEAEMKVVVDPEGLVDELTEIELSVESDAPAAWEGTLEIESKELGVQTISLSYSAKPDGRWEGKQYYFGQFGDQGVEDWRTDPASESQQQNVKNAFVRKCAGLRSLMKGSGGKTDVPLFEAVLQSTLTESWRWPSMQEICPVAACLPYDNAQGYVPYVDDLDDAPIPSGVVELPIALNLRVKSDLLTGKIVSEESLHYAGDPAISIAFEADPAQCTQSGENCLAFTDPQASTQVAARAIVGGRYSTVAQDTHCQRAGDGLVHQTIPSLIPGFSRDIQTEPNTGLSYVHQCRDAEFPYASSDAALSVSLSEANPVPDGRRRVRALEIVDGVMVDGETLYLLFKEYFEGAALGGSVQDELPAYGMMVLRKTNANLEGADFKGTTPKDVPTDAISLEELTTCDAALLSEAIGTTKIDSGNASDLVEALLDGVVPLPPEDGVDYPTYAADEVHYLCHETGRFDQGPGGAAEPSACPAGSGVTFFTGALPTDLSHLVCQAGGDCSAVLENWEQDPSKDLLLDPVWVCEDENQVYCDRNRIDLRVGKKFYEPLQNQVLFPPLQMEIENAFRYRIQFQNREGKGLGFAPALCEKNSSAVPYCYDPAAIERVEERVDCLTWVFSHGRHLLQEDAFQRVRNFLTINFSYEEDNSFKPPVVHDGFEFLNAQLLITLGDEAFASAFQSRFDLAGVARAGFEGSKFESNGIDLSGVAGFEMYTLYQAVQYYQRVLDRFFSHAGYLREDVRKGVTANPPKPPLYVTQEAVTSYMDRTLRASAQKSRAYSEIAKRYQSFQRPDLARRVVERAYTGAYLESMLVTRLMVEISDSLVASDRAQVRAAIDKAQLVFRAAMLEMRELYSSLNDQVNAYGFTADYIPFPELLPGGPNAFHVLLATAQQRMETARQHEENALSQSTAVDTSQEQFQQELAGVRTNYENQLAELCGTFQGDDGNIYPAIGKYAYLNERARLFGDPCGLMGNGAIHEAMAGLEGVQLDVSAIQNAFRDVEAKIEIEEDRITSHCDTLESIADYRYRVAGEVRDLNEDIASTRATLKFLEQMLAGAAAVSEIKACTTGAMVDSCMKAIPLAASFASLLAKVTGQAKVGEYRIVELESEIADIEREAARWESDKTCELARIESDSLVKNYLLEVKSIELDALRTEYQIRLALSQISKLRNQATRLYAEQRDTEQLAINVEAARNDPNVRIYKNDAIINADRSFHAALRAAYQATKAYEYYSSQSYAGLDVLPLVRLVARGDYSLETYLRELEDDYASFAEVFGTPKQRVDVLSLRDDILSIPRHAEDGTSLSEGERIQLFRNVLTGNQMLDGNGYLTIPFATALSRLSPATHNHKIVRLEAEVIGSDVGDGLGRIYVRQSGTGIVRTSEETKSYYRFPERMAVLDPFFNGVKSYDPELYQNHRFRDRPYGNTHWELLVNRAGEVVNQDINLSSLSDIRLLVFYSDFTTL